MFLIKFQEYFKKMYSCSRALTKFRNIVWIRWSNHEKNVIKDNRLPENVQKYCSSNIGCECIQKWILQILSKTKLKKKIETRAFYDL